ncbi:hypothetical protein GO001_15370 [Streptomyces sp. NRRL B-1677]|nr:MULTISPECIES: hypothetical protein [Streptomyces]MBF6046593.1 hypothetical protein [Streptomyces sp. NRRL B-1677]
MPAALARERRVPPLLHNSPDECEDLMRRNGSTEHPDATGSTQRNRHPGSMEAVALVNGVTASIGGTYVVTSSLLIAALAGVLAVAVVTLHLKFGS